MQVEFQKTGERRYSIVIHREELPTLKMDPAPGFDPLMPHDLLHFIVEKEFGLTKGIFGQIAEGGTAGTFQPIPSKDLNRRKNARRRKANRKRGRRLLKKSPGECAQSERATYVCLYDWLSHSDDPSLRIRAREMKENLASIYGAMSKPERARFNKRNLAVARSKMDEASNRWTMLRVNQSFSLEW